MQPEDTTANAGHLRAAPDAAIPNFAEFSIRRARRPSPYRALVIFNESKDRRFIELRILSELAVLPACEPIPCADPKGPCACRNQSLDDTGREMLIWRWLPKDVSDAIEAIQAKCRPQPEVSVGCLG